MEAVKLTEEELALIEKRRASARSKEFIQDEAAAYLMDERKNREAAVKAKMNTLLLPR